VTVNRRFEYVIIGGGLAGISLASELLNRNHSICLIDSSKIAAGASGTPLGLANYATGRFAKPAWNAGQCIAKLRENLEYVQSNVPVQVFKENGVLRPAMTEKIALAMKEQLHEDSWPDNRTEWLTPSDAKNMNPYIQSDLGALWLPKALTVNVPAYLRGFTDLLTTRGLDLFENANYSYSKNKDGWQIKLSSADIAIQARRLIICAGYSSKKFAEFKWLPLTPVKGQLAIIKTKKKVSFGHSVSALGYIASLNRQEFVLGSTYEHDYDHENPDEFGLNYVTKRAKKVLPDLVAEAEVVGRWAGVRASTQNRKPIAGIHPHIDDLYVFCGLGSKGLLYSGYISELFANLLEKGKSLPAETSIKRVYPTPTSTQ